MGRALLSFRVSDQLGNVAPSVPVVVLEADGVTLLAQTLYAAPTGPSTRTNPLITDQYGLALAYAETPQRAAAAVGGIVTPIDISDDPADLGSGGSGPIPANTITSAMIVDGTIQTADIGDFQVTNAKLAADAVTTDKIAAGAVTTLDIALQNVGSGHLIGGGPAEANTVLRTTTGVAVVFGKVTTPDIALQNVGSGHLIGGGPAEANTVLRTTNGTNVVFGKVTAADIASGVLFANPMTTTQDLIVGGASGAPTRMAKGANSTYLRVSTGGALEYGALPVDPGFANPMTTAGDLIVGGASGAPGRTGKGANSTVLGVDAGGTLGYTTVTSAMIADGTIVNADIAAAAAIAKSKLAALDVVDADVNSAAAIAVTKLAHVGAGNVLRSNGTTNAAGQVATGDIAANAVTQRGAAQDLTGTPVTTTSTTLVDMTAMSVTLTTVGGDLLVWFTGVVTNDTGAKYAAISAALDGTAPGDLVAITIPTAGNYNNAGLFFRWTAVSAASHTVKIQWRTESGGTARAYGRYMLVQEVKR